MNKKIVLHTNNICERGTSIAIYDYGIYLRKYLGFDPIIAYSSKHENVQEAVDSFNKEFETFGYESFYQIEHFVDTKNIDYFYAIKYGTNDGIEVKNCKNLIHSVFCYDVSQIHGDKYAVVSEWLSYKSRYNIPYVPHMINLPDHRLDLRQELGIPKHDVVIGRYGGKDTFNIDFVKSSIIDCLEKRSDLWFLFLNTEPFYYHPRCLYFNTIIDRYRKTNFINTCDAFLHARDYGETFGLSVLEFACKNKQIISYDNFELQNNHPLGGINHFLYLNDNCFRYSNHNELQNIFLHISKHNPFDTNYLNELFSPKIVIEKFKNVFIDGE